MQSADVDLGLLLAMVENIRTRQRHELRRMDAVEGRLKRLEAESSDTEHAYLESEDAALRDWKERVAGRRDAEQPTKTQSAVSATDVGPSSKAASKST